MNNYVRTPDAVHYDDIINNNLVLSSSLFVQLVMPNSNYKKLSEFLTRPLNRKDLGTEVGSLSYIKQSPKYFIRTKALQEHSFLPDFNSETCLPILPREFVNMHLKEGDVIISKDSNIGEAVILDRDYPNCMLSGAIYKLPIKAEWKYYTLAFIKHKIFREQLDAIVPKGATIRHAKTKFLDCLIPLPNIDSDNVIQYVSLLTQSIINKEKLIKQRYADIIKIIDKELKNNQIECNNTYQLPTLNDIQNVGRLDTGLYTERFHLKKCLIQNYRNGYTSFLELNNGNVEIVRGQNLQESNIGKSVYSDLPHSGFYRLALSKNFTNYQTITDYTYIGNSRDLKCIKEGEIIFSCRGDMGRSLIYCESVDNVITNIDSVHISFRGQELYKTIFISQFLGYLRYNQYIQDISITGSGADSFTKYHFELLMVPNFAEPIQKEIATLYHNPAEYDASDCAIESFLEYDSEYNSKAGIYELDKTAKHLKELLDDAIDKIVKSQEVKIKF